MRQAFLFKIIKKKYLKSENLGLFKKVKMKYFSRFFFLILYLFLYELNYIFPDIILFLCFRYFKFPNILI